jgi:hypothetical protein
LADEAVPAAGEAVVLEAEALEVAAVLVEVSAEVATLAAAVREAVGNMISRIKKPDLPLTNSNPSSFRVISG